MSEPQLQDGLSPEWRARYDAECAALKRKFFLRTLEGYYSKDSDTVEALEALGFDFSANGNPHSVTKIGNPVGPYEIYDMAHLAQFIAKHGPVCITGENKLYIMGGHATHLDRLAEVREKIEGYKSVWAKDEPEEQGVDAPQ